MIQGVEMSHTAFISSKALLIVVKLCNFKFLLESSVVLEPITSELLHKISFPKYLRNQKQRIKNRVEKLGICITHKRNIPAEALSN